MCKASTEPGGPKRCAAHARHKLQETQETFTKVENQLLYAKALRDAASTVRPTFFTGKNKDLQKVEAAAKQLFADDPVKLEKFLTNYNHAWETAVEQIRPLKAEAVELDSITVDDGMYSARSRLNQIDAELRAINPYDIMVKEDPETFDFSEYNDKYFNARRARDEAKQEYLGTEEGLLNTVLKPTATDTEIKEAVDMFSRESRYREAVRRYKMESIRLHAKATTRSEDWQTYRVWQDAWYADPTIMNNDSYNLVEKTENTVTLRLGVAGWLLFLERNPETGKIKRTVSYR